MVLSGFRNFYFLESFCNLNAWGCVCPEKGIACLMFCVVVTKTRLSGLSPDYFRGQACPDLWPEWLMCVIAINRITC